MALFITYDDLAQQLKPELLAQLVGNDQTLYDQCIRRAQAKVEAFLNQQFDTDVDLSKVGAARSTYLVEMVAVQAIGFLLRRTTPKFVPEGWLDTLADSQEELKMIKDGKLTPPGLTRRREGTEQTPVPHVRGGGWKPAF